MKYRILKVGEKKRIGDYYDNWKFVDTPPVFAVIDSRNIQRAATVQKGQEGMYRRPIPTPRKPKAVKRDKTFICCAAKDKIIATLQQTCEEYENRLRRLQKPVKLNKRAIRREMESTVYTGQDAFWKRLWELIERSR